MHIDHWQNVLRVFEQQAHRLECSKREKWRTICRLLCSAINTRLLLITWCTQETALTIAIVCRMWQATCVPITAIKASVLLHRGGKQTRAAYMVLNASRAITFSLDAISFRTRDWSAKPIFVYSTVHAAGCDDRLLARPPPLCQNESPTPPEVVSGERALGSRAPAFWIRPRVCVNLQPRGP